MPGLGTLINLATVAGGTATGLLVGARIPERLRVTVLQAVGLITLALGTSEVIGTDNIVFPLVAVVIGAFVGELLRLEDRLEAFGDGLRSRFERSPEAPDGEEPPEGGEPADDPSTFVEGFVAASLLFCVGPLAILGSIQDGLRGDISLLVVKSALDGLVSIIFAATLGWGVGFSVVTVAVYQGLLTLGAGTADSLLSDRMILEMTATGGVMVMAIALRLLDIKRVRVASMLPGLAIAPVLVAIFAR